MWPFHRHKWRVIKVEKGEYSLFGRGSASLLHYKCSKPDCHAVKTETINGWWDLTDFE